MTSENTAESPSEKILSLARQLYETGEAGFSDVDAATASVILKSERVYTNQLRSLWTVLKSYSSHLATLGIDFDVLTLPSVPVNGTDKPTWSQERVIVLKQVTTKEGPKVAIGMAYDAKLISLVQSFPSRRWDKTGAFSGVPKSWVISANPIDVDIAIKTFRAIPGVHLEVQPELLSIVESGKRYYEESRAEASDLKIPTKLELYPFQRAGVKWIDEHDGRAFVADEMGVGKTIQALGWLTLRPEKALPAFIICPQIVRVNWYREIQRFTDFKPVLVAGKTSAPSFKRAGLMVSEGPIAGHEIMISNYDLLSVETTKTWLKYLLGGKKDIEKYGEEHLVLAGHQAVELLKKAMEKYKDIDRRNRMARVLGKIEDLGSDARRVNAPVYKLVFVNGIPFEEFMRAGFKTLVCDESHFVKDPDAQRTQATIAISEIVQNSICMTGTPVDNRPRELWSQLKIVKPSLFPSFFEYGRRYCAAFKKPAGKHKTVWDFSGASNTEELEKVLRSTVMIRRTKEQVLKELPSKTRTMIPFIVEAEAEGRYKEKEEKAFKRLRDLRTERREWKALMETLSDEERKAYISKHAEKASRSARLTDIALAEIEELKQEAVDAKLPEAIKFVFNLQAAQGKVLVYAVHHKTIDRLVAAFRNEGIKTDFIDGRVTGTNRQNIIDGFQKGDIEILVCGIRAASIGLTLTACHTVVFLELDWNPGKHSQAEDRVYRIGQSKPVTIYYLLLLASIEEKIAKMIDAKREIAASIVGEGERTAEEGGILDAVMDEVLGEDGA